jgi:membrane-associated phospholipid phosphatase
VTTPQLLALAALLVVVTIVLGYIVKTGPPSAIDVAADRVFRGRGKRVAWLLTRSGYVKWLAILYAALGAVAVVDRRFLPDVFLLLVAQMLSQLSVHGLKQHFARVRPDEWLVRAERGKSFPSGHATTAAVTYGGLLAVALLEPLPQWIRIASAVVLVSWILGICWSRIALRAHHLTDVAAGYLFGVAWLCLFLAVHASLHGGRSGNVATNSLPTAMRLDAITSPP